jgi:hypothetical protein
LAALTEKIWDEILAVKASHIDHFLRVYYASHAGKRAGHRSLFDDFMREFFPDTLAPSKILQKLNNIRSAFILYNFISEGDWPYEDSGVTVWDRNRLKLLLQVLKNELSLPLLLAAYALTEKNFAAVVRILEFAVFRYIHCCRQHPGKLDSIFLANADESFAAKKKLFAESKVLLNRELAKFSKFGDKQLQDREDELVKRGLAIFRM